MAGTKKENRCWPGYEPVKGKKPNSQGSCKPKAESKLKPAEKGFRAKRKKQLDDWQKEHKGSRRQSAQHLHAPETKATTTKKRSAAKKTAAKKS
jgi:hypothetical protein